MENLFAFLEKNSIYIVLVISIIVWSGIFAFLMSIDKQLKKIELQLNDKNSEN